MSDTGSAEIPLRIRCYNLPGSRFERWTGLRLGVQRGRSEVVQDVSADEAQATFDVTLKVSGEPSPDAGPDFTGPFAQGTRGDRFVYLTWGMRQADNGWDIVRRAKLRLGAIEWEWIAKARQTGEPLEVVIDATDAKGGPVCASLSADQVTWRY
ncbi:MAG TPA: DUF5990 family protein [Armatimonadaceae bacterium]|nr:DUF5990 family protein [Armatimonadaceae bacterium]